MKLFKFFSLFPLALSAIIFAETKYVAFKIYGDRVVYVNEALCNPDNYIGTDVVLSEKISGQIPQLKGVKVNVWQMAQLAGIAVYGLGLRGREVTNIVNNVVPDSLQSVAATVFPFDFIDNVDTSNDNQAEGNPTNASIAFAAINNSQNPFGAAQFYVRSCLAAKKALAGVEFGYDDAEGYYMRPCGGYLTITDITSSMGIGLSKMVENVIVDKSKDWLGFDEFGQRMVRAGVKTVYLGTSMWAKGQFGWFAYVEPKTSDVSPQSTMPTSLLDSESMPLSTIPSSNANQKSKSDLADHVQPSGSVIAPAPILSSGSPVHAGGRAALFDDIKKKKTLKPVEQDEAEMKKSDEQQLFENAAQDNQDR